MWGGESPAEAARAWADEGSPPHVWGKLFSLPKTLTLNGITPTCVGKAASVELLPKRQ